MKRQSYWDGGAKYMTDLGVYILHRAHFTAATKAAKTHIACCFGFANADNNL